MKFKSITYKWVFNFISIITAILIVINLILYFSIKKYFDNYAKEYINLNETIFNNSIEPILDENTNKITDQIKNTIKNFINKENIMIVASNYEGKVVANSSNLSLNDTFSFNDEIFKNQKFTKIKNKEETILVSNFSLPFISNEISNIFFSVSMKTIEKIIKTITLIMIILSLLIVFLIVISGMFFIKYFVNPIKEIIIIIKKIAGRNFKNKITKKYHYEIKELCDSINFMAKELNNSEYAKNEFISSVSHELRTPLTAIRGWSETIINTKENNTEILNKGMNVISREVLRLATMVEELLDFSKIENGHFILKKDKMDLFAELEEAILTYSDIALKEGKTLIYNEQKAVPIIFGDKNKIRQVFINIIDNAIKYSEKGDTITIDTIISNKTTTIIVKDTGCGISKKDLPHISEKFFKSNLTKKGSGIGLSIVKEIVEKHDGKIYFESSLGKGTTVTIEFNLFNS